MTITDPDDGAVVNGTVVVQAEADDESDIDRVDFYIDGVFKEGDPTRPYAYSWNSDLVADGSHTIRATAVDLNGVQGSDEISVVVSDDTTGPTVSISRPSNGELTALPVLPVWVTASDPNGIDRIEYNVGGIAEGSFEYYDTTDEYFAYLETSSWPEGTNTISVTAYDTIGNPSTVSVTVVLDRIRPTVRLTSPDDGTTVSGTIPITGTISDSSGTIAISLHIDGDLKESVYVDSESFSFQWNTDVERVGDHFIRIWVTDGASNWGWDTATVTVRSPHSDTTPPTVSIASPANGASLCETTPVQVNTSDAADVDRVEFYVDGTFYDYDTGSPFYDLIEPEHLGDGSHSITAVAFDNNGNSNSTSINVNVDLASCPNPITINWPSSIVDGATVSGIVPMNLTASTADFCFTPLKITLINLSIDDILRTFMIFIGFLNYDWNTDLEMNGTHAITVAVRDCARNTHSETRIVTVENDPLPVVTITEPYNGATVNGAIDIKATATDASGINRVEFLVDGVLKHTDTSADYVFPWNSNDVAYGTHTITARAIDNQNSPNEHSITVTVDNRVTYSHLSSWSDVSEPYWSRIYRDKYGFSHVDPIVHCADWDYFDGSCTSEITTEYHYRIPRFNADNGLWWQAYYGPNSGLVPGYFKTDIYGNVYVQYATNWQWIIDEYKAYYTLPGDYTVYSIELEKTIWPCERRSDWANVPTTNAILNASFVWISDGDRVDPNDERIVAFPQTTTVLGAVVGGASGPTRGDFIDHRSRYEYRDGYWYVYISGSLTGGESPMQSTLNVDRTYDNLNGDTYTTSTVNQVVDEIRWIRDNPASPYPNAPIRIIGHSLGGLEATLIYNMKNTWDGSSFLRSGDEVHALAVPYLNADRMQQSAGAATYNVYISWSDSVAGGGLNITYLSNNGVNVRPVSTPAIWGHDRSDYNSYIRSNYWSWWPDW